MQDVIVVGAGPAGLSAALILGRARRSVTVYDTEEHRNAVSHALHGYLTRDCTPPLEFLKMAREELAPYESVEIQKQRVIDARREGPIFCVKLEGGDEVMCRALVLATGVEDTIPDIEGIHEFYGRSVHHCPYCDGWEWRDQPIAIFGDGDAGRDMAFEMTTWSRDLVLLTDGTCSLSMADVERMHLNAITIREEHVVRLEGEDGMLREVVFADGARLPRTALFFVSRERERSELAAKLGASFDPYGVVRTDEHEATNVPGLFVAGDASRRAQMVIVAAAEGAQAAATINGRLLAEDLA